MTETLLDVIQRMPKVELHRHLEGSMRLTTLLEIARTYDNELKEMELERLRPFVQMTEGQPFSSQSFLSKFRVLRQFYNSPETIRRITREAVIDAAEDNVRYMELRFTPKALCNVLLCDYFEVMDWVCDTVEATVAEYPSIKVRLLVSMNRHEGAEIGREVLQVALRYRNRGVVGIDLAGQEKGVPSLPFAPIFHEALAEGLHTTVHAGEWEGAQSVVVALNDLRAERIGHGIRAIEDHRVVALLAERQITLEVCPTSNKHSGVVHELEQHPLVDLFHAGVRTTINTDDPLISNINLTTELLDAMFTMHFTLAEIQAQTMNAARAAFLPQSERAELINEFELWFKNNPLQTAGQP
ncbi:MAG: adenosine deaminase [Phototrophicaceae bacterium]